MILVMLASPPLKTIVSASRRTDIPAFYMDWFMAGITKGCFEVINPYNHHRRRVSAQPHEIHSIVFWSKNFGPFLRGNFDRKLQQRGYPLFFNFTINATDRQLEPHVPPLAERIQQITELARRHDPLAITWRFDPLCFFSRSNKVVSHHHLDALEPIADALAAIGIRRCVTSFVDLYRKVRLRLPEARLELVDPPLAVKVETLTTMAAALRKRQIDLHVCCEQTILNALPSGTGFRSGACIPGPLLADLFGGGFAMKKDPGQRRTQGCTCNIAADIGSYHQQPCYHDCLFCYANPQAPSR
ncbi:MAG: DUF1848 family protein, partial [Desulfobacteraceae bacterium]|nr:DUF1848 family protein [Desulfobacteraceae bacterium]